ncbi:MAG: polysaccharide deacetylase family protein [Hyphomicrobium sp.]|nr:polysaccharide deacetylase family protein [Hyphomicrobium sp.]
MNWAVIPFATLALAALTITSARAECADPAKALGVERVVEIDTTHGPLYGEISVLQREERFLGPKEVVLTFDDGPMPWITGSILDTLDKFCTKATFFSVGRMAIAYPKSTQDILARGHTLGGHTWSHPLNLKRLSVAKATDQIERGFSAIAMAAGQPIAPFFRFPGLSDSNAMLSHLQSRGIAAFTVDVVSNDSYIGSADRLETYTLDQIEKQNGGIVLFHDIKSATAKALPRILATLKVRGYKVVHMRAKAPLVPLADYDSDLKPLLEKAMAKGVPSSDGATATIDGQHALPFFGSPAVLKSLSGEAVEVAALAPPARERAVTSADKHRSDDAAIGDAGTRPKARNKWRPRVKPAKATADPAPLLFFPY